MHNIDPTRMTTRTLAWLTVLAAAAGLARAEDWPTYRHDNRRSGVTREKPALPLKQAWVHVAPTPPQPAWPGPAKWDAYAGIKGLKSMRNFDAVFHVTVVGDAVYFGSSADDAVYCLDAATGQERWSHCTDGPVRLPPACDDGKVYFGSDDGCIYCLDGTTGSPVWKYRPASDPRLVPSDGKLISLWPCRTGVLVQGGRAYAAASLLPWRASFLCALNADTGDGLYKSEHKDVTMQGALLASSQRLYVPQGRSAPLLFEIGTGKGLGAVEGGGGTYALLTQDAHLIHGPGNKTGWLAESDGGSRDHLVSFGGATRMIVAGTTAYLHDGEHLSAFDRAHYLDLQRQKRPLVKKRSETQDEIKKLGGKGDRAKSKKLIGQLRKLKTDIAALDAEMAKCFGWKTDSAHPHELILAGNVLLAGGDNGVAAFDARDGKPLWNAPVVGKAHGLALANGRLFVSTDRGRIHCFVGS